MRVRFTRSVADVERADLLVVPGTKATVEDLARLRAAGLDRAIVARAAAGAPILGICGGYQLLGERIADEVESGQGEVAGLGVLPVVTTFERDKVLRRRAGRCAWLDTAAGGYEIRHGRVDAPRRRAAAHTPTTASPTAAASGTVARHVVARRARARRLPARAAAAGRRRARPALRAGQRARSPPRASAGSTSSATSWPTTSTPTASPT